MKAGALVNDATIVTFVTEDALDDAGYIVTFGSNPGTVKKANPNDLPVGVALTDSKDMDGNPQKDVKVGVIIGSGIIVKAKLSPTNTAIQYGDPLMAVEDPIGTVDKFDDSISGAKVCGYALESKGASSGGYVLMLMR